MLRKILKKGSQIILVIALIFVIMPILGVHAAGGPSRATSVEVNNQDLQVGDCIYPYDFLLGNTKKLTIEEIGRPSYDVAAVGEKTGIPEGSSSWIYRVDAISGNESNGWEIRLKEIASDDPDVCSLIVLNTTDLKNATATLSKKRGIKSNETVTLTITPNQNYRFESGPLLTCKNSNASAQPEIQPNGSYKYELQNFQYNSIIKVVGEAILGEYSATLNTAGLKGGSAVLSKTTKVLESDTVTLTVSAEQGKEFIGNPVVTVDNAKAEFMNHNFVTGNYVYNITEAKDDFTVTVTGEARKKLYEITVIDEGTFGKASSSLVKAEAGTEISLTAIPNNGYEFYDWLVIFGDIEIKDNKFVMPQSHVTIKSRFKALSVNNDESNTQNTNKNEKTKTPQTSDEANIAIIAGLIIMSGGTLYMLKRKEEIK